MTFWHENSNWVKLASNIISRNLKFAYFVELCHFDDGNRFSICNMSSSWWFQRNWTNIWKASSNLFLQFFRKQEKHWLGLVQKKILQHFMKIVYTTILELTNEDFCREYFKLFSQVEKKCKKSKELIICSVMFWRVEKCSLIWFFE